MAKVMEHLRQRQAPSRPKVFLKPEEQEKVALKAFQLSQEKAYDVLWHLLRDAIEEALPEHRRPNTIDATVEARWAWFRTRLGELAKNPPILSGVPAAGRKPGPNLDHLTDLDPGKAHARPGPKPKPSPDRLPEPRPEPKPKPEPEPEPEPEPVAVAPPPEPVAVAPPPAPVVPIAPPVEAPAPVVAERIPEGLSAAQIASMLDVYAGPAETTGLDDEEEREEWAMICAWRRERRERRALVAATDRIVALGTAIESFAGQIGGLRADLQMLPKAILDSTKELIRAQESLRVQAQAMTRPAPMPQTPGPSPSNGQWSGPAPAPPPPVMPLKPKVIVIGYTGGHQMNGVEREVAGRAVLKFTKADYAFPKYAEFDYIVVTKEAPQSWIGKAKDVYAKDRLIIQSGTAQEVGRRIAQLPAPRRR